MKIIIFGATGGTGRHLVEQAIGEGHAVTAFVRSPEKLEVSHENLRVIQGDALAYASVESAIQGHDAVICALGIPNIRDKSKLRAYATKNIVEAMKATGVERLICLSSFGAGDSFETLPFRYKYFIAPLVMRNLFVDHNLQEGYIMESQLSWTIVRPVNMTDGERTDKYQHGFSSENKMVVYKISRADTAGFMLKQLEDDAYLGKAPSLSY